MLREINVKISCENCRSCECFFQVYKILTLMEIHTDTALTEVDSIFVTPIKYKHLLKLNSLRF